MTSYGPTRVPTSTCMGLVDYMDRDAVAAVLDLISTASFELSL
jgi:hypothetical protein